MERREEMTAGGRPHVRVRARACEGYGKLELRSLPTEQGARVAIVYALWGLGVWMWLKCVWRQAGRAVASQEALQEDEGCGVILRRPTTSNTELSCYTFWVFALILSRWDTRGAASPARRFVGCMATRRHRRGRCWEGWTNVGLLNPDTQQIFCFADVDVSNNTSQTLWCAETIRRDHF